MSHGFASRRFPARCSRLAVPAIVVALAAPAGACGGLVGENGTIKLTRTTTLAAYHDGVERYVTSFEFSGQGKEVGSIVPLPGIPTKVERGGSWTLQRLEREVAPPSADRVRARDRTPSDHQSAEVILQTKIDALDITDPEGRRRRGREVGRRSRLPAHARRARDARLLRPAQPDLHGRALRRDARAAARAEHRRRHADHADDPGEGAVGAAAHPQPRSRQGRGRRRRRVPAHRRPAEAARGRYRAEPAAQRGRAGVAARRPAHRQGHGLGAAQHVVHVPASSTCPPGSSATTSRSPTSRTRCRASSTPASRAAAARPSCRADTGWATVAARRWR